MIGKDQNPFFTGDSTCGQRALYQMGLTGIPIFNVNNNCATGSSALYMGNQLIAGGIADCVLALGFEKMQRGSLSSQVKLQIFQYFFHISQKYQLLDFSGMIAQIRWINMWK